MVLGSWIQYCTVHGARFFLQDEHCKIFGYGTSVLCPYRLRVLRVRYCQSRITVQYCRMFFRNGRASALFITPSTVLQYRIEKIRWRLVLKVCRKLRRIKEKQCRSAWCMYTSAPQENSTFCFCPTFQDIFYQPKVNSFAATNKPTSTTMTVATRSFASLVHSTS